MATTTFPKQHGIRRGRWLVAGIAIIIVAIIAALLLSRRSSSSATTVSTTTIQRGNISAQVSGSGTIAAASTLDLAFQAQGTVTEVLIKEGDTVKEGQVLAHTDDRDLQSQLANAQAQLEGAQAQLAQAQQGNATPEDLAASKASVTNAQAQLQKAKTGDTTAADIASAQAQLRSAQAELDALKNPSPDKVSSAETTVKQAEITVQQTRDNTSATKTKAEQDLNKATQSLTQAQASYATAKSNWDWVQAEGSDPSNPKTTGTDGKTKKNKLTDTQRQQYYDTFVQAEAALHSAEQSVAQAQVTYDNARQTEVTDVQTAEAKLADAQQQLKALMNPSPNDITKAQASVDQAKANLQKLQQGGSKADVAAAQANVTQAQANLDKLTASATGTDLQIKQAAVTQAEQTVKQAELNLESATLKAPFAGVVTAVNISKGSNASSSIAAVSLIDRSTLHVDMSLSENDVTQVKVGMPVTLTIDAMKDWKGQGTVTYIAPSATTTNDVVTYQVRVSFPDNDDRVKVGMTANVDIVTATKDKVLLVPTSALLPKGSGYSVQVPSGNSVREVDVTTGLTDGTNTEITSGLKEGDQVVTAPSTGTTTRRSGGPFGP